MTPFDEIFLYLFYTPRFISPTKDSFITQDRNEHFEGGTHEATFSKGHSSLTWGTISKNWMPNERYEYCLSVDTRWVVVGQMVWSQQPCKVSHFSGKFKIAEKLAFFMSTETLFFAPLFSKCSHLETKQDIDFKPTSNGHKFPIRKVLSNNCRKLWSFLNSNAGLICSTIFDDFRKNLVQV